MTQQTRTAAPAGAVGATCTPAARTTRTLLAYGAIAGPFYLVVSLAQALTRDGFDLTRHAWSLLANGDLGWIQTTNLVVSGLMMIAMAAGLGRALRPGRAATWAPRLVGGYGLGMIVAGAFRADPALGFPAGTPDGPAEVSWHGMVHFGAAGLGFICLAVACFVVARRFATERRRGWAAYSRAAGGLFLAAFAGLAAGGGSAATVLGFVAAMLVVSTWTSALSVHLYRRTAA